VRPGEVTRFFFGILAALTFMMAMYGVWRIAHFPSPLSWRFAGLCLGAVLGFGVCRFFLARSALVTLFVVHFPTDPDPQRRAAPWLLPVACVTGVVALALVGFS
jgi:hypothetical protein